jgi:uncharacterized protein YjiK
MLLTRYSPYIAFIAILFFSCSSSGKKKENTGNTNKQYDLQNPYIIKLPESLAEISGIAYYPKDSSVFAIEDEDGMLYKIKLTQNNDIKKWRFDKKHDFEDLVLKDSVFYVLISNGDIETIRFGAGDSILTAISDFPDASKKNNEFESLYFDDTLQQFVLLCKDCEDDSKKKISAWGYSFDSSAYTPAVLTVNVQPVDEKLGQKMMKLKPSATAINPADNNLYILSSISHLLIVTDRAGNFKEVYPLDPALYKQAEGIAFTPAGDMIISNESHETGLANILVIKNKKKGL